MLADKPLLKMALRMLFAGIGGFLSSLVADLPGTNQDELLAALAAGWAMASGYAVLGVFTPLEPTVGKTSEPK
jgi:hypothetical protein